MYPHALQFQLSSGERDIAVLLPHEFLCLRQTANTLEFLRSHPSGRTSVIAVEGMNLGILRREILRASRIQIATGGCGPEWSRCFVARITHRLGWTTPKERLALDPNSLPSLYLQCETGTTRDVWLHSHLSAFAVPRNPTQEKFLLQFHDKHAYVLETDAGMFSPMLSEFKRANFRYDMVNRFSVFHENPYPAFPGLDTQRHNFRSITYDERDLASRSDWSVILDYRDTPSVRQSPDMGL